MSPTPLRLAIVGVDHPHGAHWRQLLAQFGEQIEMVAVVPGFGGATASLEERLTGLPRFGSVERLVAEADFDSALVCLPNAETPAVLQALARAGKHLLVEKPCGCDAAAFEPAAAAIESSGVAFQNGYMWRYDEIANRLRRMAADGQFGRLISVEMTYVTSDVARRGPDHYLFDHAASGGGFFNWLAVHYLDLLLFITGQSVVGVTARVGVFGSVGTSVEDGGTAILELSGGGLATFTGGYWLPRWAGENRWSLRGTQRWVTWEPSRPGTAGAIDIHGPQPQWHPMEDAYSAPPDNLPGYGGRRGHDLVADWLTAARRPPETRRRCRNTTTSTADVLKLLDAIYESSRTGRRVACEIGPTLERPEGG